MLEMLVLIRLVLAFVVGSLWVTVATIIAEKKGAIIGGILGGFPSTAAFSFLFIAINQSTDVAVNATTVFPLAFAITNAYLFLYAFFAKKGFKVGLSVSLLIWLVSSTLIVLSGITDYIVALTGGAVISAITFYLFSKKLKLAKFEGERTLYRTSEVFLRGLGAGAIVAVSVLLSQIGGPVLGGVAATFPAVFTSTLLILHHSKGTEFTRSISKPLAYSGILTVIPYSILVHFLYPLVGIWFGTLFSYLLVFPLVLASYYAANIL
ncbi:MAG: DUF3147 family protein [Candidatus Bathyarchaeia archaeon]|jgi:uncharacterized membrane protein (GlpM family)